MVNLILYPDRSNRPDDPVVTGYNIGTLEWLFHVTIKRHRGRLPLLVFIDDQLLITALVAGSITDARRKVEPSCLKETLVVSRKLHRPLVVGFALFCEYWVPVAPDRRPAVFLQKVINAVELDAPQILAFHIAASTHLLNIGGVPIFIKDRAVFLVSRRNRNSISIGPY